MTTLSNRFFALAALFAARTASADTLDASSLAAPHLGTGVEGGVGGQRGDCVTGTPTQEGIFQSTLLVDAPVDPARLASVLSPGRTTDLASPWPLAEPSAALFMTNAAPTDTSLTVVYGYEMRGRFLRLTSPTPSAIGTQQIALLPEARRTACGDAFLSRIEIGGSVYVSVRFDFASKAARDRTNNDFDVGRSSLANLSAKVQRIASMSHDSFGVTLAAVQRGGDPTQLVRIFGRSTTDMPILRCTAASPQDCAAAIDAVRTYIVDPVSGFHSQIDPPSGAPSPESGPRPLKLETSSYTDAALGSLTSPALDAAVQAAAAQQQQLRAAIVPREQARAQLVAKSVYQSLSDDDRAQLDRLGTDLDVLRQAHEYCADYPKACAAAASDALASIAH